MEYKLRPYQQECIKAILTKLQEGVRLQAIVMGTGTGKTLCFSQLPPIVKAKGKKTLVLAHREELLEQAKEKIEAVTPELRVEIEQGERIASPDADVIIASVATLGRTGSERIKKFDPDSIGLVITDEMHHCTGQTYQNIYSYLGCNKQTGLKENHPVMIGFTATPNRADNQGLDKVFDEVVFKYDMRDAIEDGYLVRIKAYTVNTNESLDGISIRAGDFAIGELSKTVNTPERNKLILESYKTICDYEKAIVFAVDVNHAIELSKMFKDDGYNSEVVTGETPKDERKQIIKDFKDGKIHVLSNVGVFIEGFDEPSTKAILLARPTKSAGLYIQQVGRGTRLFPGKTEVKIIDFVDNMTKNSIISSSSLIGLDKPIKANGHDLMDLKEKYEELLANKPNADIRNIEIDDIDRLITEVDIFKLAQIPEVVKNSSNYSWISYLEGFRLNLGKLDDGSSLGCDIRENAIGQRDVIFYKNIKVDPCFKNGFKKSVFQKEHSFSVRDKITAIEQADRYVYKNYKERIYLVDQYSNRRGGKASEKQVALLKKFGFPNAGDLSKGEAANLLNKIFAEKNSKK